MKQFIGLIALSVIAALFYLSILPSQQAHLPNLQPEAPSSSNDTVSEAGDSFDTAAALANSVTKPNSFSSLPERLANYAQLPSIAKAPIEISPALINFEEWLEQKPKTNNSNEQTLWQQEGIMLAKARQVEMQQLMREHPRFALAHAISFPNYQRLPDEVKTYIEEPFSSIVTFDILPNEEKAFFHQKSKSYIGVEELSSTLSQQQWQVHRYGSRENILSKRKMIVQGIRLGDEAVINEQAIMPIAQHDLAYFKQHFPLAKKHTNAPILQDFYTNEVIKGEPIFALAGGKLLAFASAKNIQQLNKQLAELEQKHHPHYSSALIFSERASSLNSMIQSSTDQTADNQSLAQQLIKLLSLPDNWTTTNKRVLLIRARPVDAIEPAVSQSDLENALNNSSELIKTLSQNKTFLNISVSSQAFDLSETSRFYATSDARVVLNEAKDLFRAANPNIDLNSFDIVGIHISGKTLPTGWAGLATLGGTNYWLNNTLSLDTITHEFGHIYGIDHASFWVTNTTATASNGSNEEYGDIYDIMGKGDAPAGYFHPQALVKLNWLEPTDWIDITTSGKYRVYRFDDEQASNYRGLRIRRNGGIDGYYWLAYRQNFDENHTLENGAYLIWQRPNQTRSWLVDTTPNSFVDDEEDKQDAGIGLGQTYSDNTANIHITTLAKGGVAPNEWLDIQVNFGRTNNQRPTVSLLMPDAPTARKTLTFTVNASDSNNDTLAYDWDFGDGVIYPNQASVSKSWVVGGTYTVKVTVSDMNGGTATAQQTITVVDSLNQWHNRSSTTNHHITDIAANDTDTMVLAMTDFSVLGSSDGETWTTLDERRDEDTGFDFNTYLNSMIYDPLSQQWIIVGENYNNDWEGAIYTSPDGINWTKRYQGGEELNAVASSGNTLVAVGRDGYAVRSLDGGLTWSSVDTGLATSLIDISYGNGQFIAVGNKYIQGHQAAVLTSVDGQLWTNQTTASGSGTNNGFRRIAYLNDQFIAAGFNSRLSYLANHQGTNFVTTRAEREPTDALMYGNGIYFAAGIKQNDKSDIDLISFDGRTWEELPLNSDIQDRNAGVFFKNTFITVGDKGLIRQSNPITAVDNNGSSCVSSNVTEGNTSNPSNCFQLAIDNPLSVDASVAYITRSGTANAGEDFIATSGIATIPAGETQVVIEVEIIADNLAEENETFSLVITNPVGGVFPEGVSEVVATHTIIDDD